MTFKGQITTMDVIVSADWGSDFDDLVIHVNPRRKLGEMQSSDFHLYQSPLKIDTVTKLCV